MSSSSNKKNIRRIWFGNKLITLNRVYEFTIEYEDGIFYLSNSKLNIYVYGETIKKAEKNIGIEFINQYLIYANEKDDKLDNNAKKLKNELLNSTNFDVLEYMSKKIKNDIN